MQGYSWEQGKAIPQNTSETSLTLGTASHSGAAKAAPEYLETKHELPSECNHCESPCAADELELTPCCHTPLCPECYELEVLENEKCPNSVCMCKLSKSLKRVSVVDSELYKYKGHFLNEPTEGESSRTAAARTPLSATAKPFVPNKSNSPVSHENAATPSFRTAQASPPEDLLVSEHEFLDSEGSAPWEDDEQLKTQEARQTLEAATAHLIEVYNAMAEFLSEEERSSIFQGIVKSSGGKLIQPPETQVSSLMWYSLHQYRGLTHPSWSKQHPEHLHRYYTTTADRASACFYPSVLQTR